MLSKKRIKQAHSEWIRKHTCLQRWIVRHVFNAAVPETKITFLAQREFLQKQLELKQPLTALPLVSDVVLARIFIPGMLWSVFTQNLYVPAGKSGQECWGYVMIIPTIIQGSRAENEPGGWASVSPPAQNGLGPLGCKIKAVQIESQQDLLPPLSSRCKLENAVSHPGQGRAGARPVEAKQNWSSAAITPAGWILPALSWDSLCSTGIIVGHQAEPVNDRGQLLKLLPAKHSRLSWTEDLENTSQHHLSYWPAKMREMEAQLGRV